VNLIFTSRAYLIGIVSMDLDIIDKRMLIQGGEPKFYELVFHTELSYLSTHKI
jgi:hypothetical protein